MLPHIFNGTLREHYLLLFSMAGGLSEGQRFTARLLSERQPVILSPKQENSGRVVTPH